jgi:hypothetical protein
LYWRALVAQGLIVNEKEIREEKNWEKNPKSRRLSFFQSKRSAKSGGKDFF